MKKILLDTNAYSNLMNGNEEIFNVILNADIVFFPTIVVGELHAGFWGGSKFQQNKKQLAAFLTRSNIEVVNISVETAIIFGELKYKLKNKGKPIPINDVWIAAASIENGALLVTLDNHFFEIEGLRIWDQIDIV